MFATISIIAAIFAGGSQEIENPVLTLADNIHQSDRIDVISYVGAALEAEPENIYFQRRTEYTIKSRETIRHLASLVRANANAERRNSSTDLESAHTIYVIIRGYAKDSDESLFMAQVYEDEIMFDRGDARYWVELPPPDSDARSELYKRLANMDFNFDKKKNASDEK